MESVDMGLATGGEKFMMKNMKRILLKRNMMNMGGGMKNTFFRYFFSSAWGPRRELPKLQQKTFNKLWKEQQEKLKKSAPEDELSA
jgi:hypothetical protein